jgi:rod shape-determining protein MreC
VHDKTIRRRRAVLLLLVVVSLILLTDYFGESPSSPLHQIQRGIAEVFSPVQDGASKVLSPVRDIGNWVSSTLKAKSEVAGLRATNAKLAGEVSADNLEGYRGLQATKQLGLDTAIGLNAYHPIGADVTWKDPLLWYETIEVDKGSDAGVRPYDAVVGDGALVGDVTTVDSSYSVVTLLTNPKFAAGATIENDEGASGLLQPDVGNPGTLQLSYLPSNANVSYQQEVVTAGFMEEAHDASIESLYPPGIPIGWVSNRNTQNSVLENQEVQVTPSVDLLHLDVVQILTKPYGSSSKQ